MSITDLLARDKDIILYRKELNIITKKVTATILLQQMIYWHTKNGGTFYKFIEPSANNSAYTEGDSWCEELGFSVKEFNTAYKVLEDLGVVSKKINMSRITFYTLNMGCLSKLLNGIYVTAESEVTYPPKGHLDIDQALETETTTETTTDITPIPPKTEIVVSDTIPYVQIINHLNATMQTEFRPSSEKTRSLIKARFNEGFTLEDFQHVHIVKLAEWGNDEKMAKFLRPETLYSNKFEGYRNQRITDYEKSKLIQQHTGMSPSETLAIQLAEADRQWEQNHAS